MFREPKTGVIFFNSVMTKKVYIATAVFCTCIKTCFHLKQFSAKKDKNIFIDELCSGLGSWPLEEAY